MKHRMKDEQTEYGAIRRSCSACNGQLIVVFHASSKIAREAADKRWEEHTAK